MNKKAIAILGAIFLLIVGTLGFLIFSKYSGNKTDNQNTVNTQISTSTGTSLNQNQNNNSTTTDSSWQDNDQNNNDDTPVGPKFIKLTEDQVISPVLFYNNKGITYLDRQGQLFQSDLKENNGRLELAQKRQLNIPQKAGISKILWPQKGDSFLAKISSGAASTWSLFNSKTGMYADFPPQITSVSWMPTGDKILYIWLQDGKATLNISDPDSANWQQVAEMWEQDDDIFVSPDGTSVLYYRTNNQEAANAISLTSPDGKFWKSLVKEGYNLGVLWSPDSQKFLFGKKNLNTQKYQLWIYNILTGEVKNLGLYTNVDKAVWDNDSRTIYASVPASGTSGGGSLTTDMIVKMDTDEMKKDEYPSSDVSMDARDLLINSQSTQLFFRNAQDGGLYYLDLTQ